MHRLGIIMFLGFTLPAAWAQELRSNVLLISIDDLNDWVGVLDGHPQAKTPNLDAFAARSTLFTNAHCQAPVCNPSRVSLMTSRYPSSTGVYFLNPPIQKSVFEDQVVTLPTRFSREGYQVFAAGKLFHNRDNAEYFDEYAGNFGGFGPTPEQKISQPHGHPLWDWGAYPERTDEMPDDKIANWAVEQLQKDYDKPFFMGVGFFRPHVPMFAPQEWFDKHPRESIQLPKVRNNDRDDISKYGRDLTTLEHVAPTHEWVSEANQWDHAVQAYLASTTFADACVGKVLDALVASPHADNTIVVIFSDHGFHLGEKERWAKRSLWEDGTRVPLMIQSPTHGHPSQTSAPAELIDIYPTLLDLAGLTSDSNLEGQSLRPLLDDPAAQWNHPARTTFGPGNHSIRTKRWRYIRYADGSEELYDHDSDPNEWENLANREEYEKVLADHRKWLPKTHAPILGQDSTGHKAFAAAEAARN
ncbi:MAG: sulfatase [Candidatus Hydrogenedentota bacterium]